MASFARWTGSNLGRSNTGTPHAVLAKLVEMRAISIRPVGAPRANEAQCAVSPCPPFAYPTACPRNHPATSSATGRHVPRRLIFESRARNAAVARDARTGAMRRWDAGVQVNCTASAEPAELRYRRYTRSSYFLRMSTGRRKNSSY
jgi:hypothetical protein